VSWRLHPQVIFLNHGSFGACPAEVLDKQAQLRARMEQEPVRFFTGLEPELDSARVALSRFLGCDPEGFAFVPNATAGINTVLRSLRFSPGDVLLTTNHEYNASRNALEFAADRDGAHVDVALIPFPLQSPDEVVDAVMAKVTARTRLVLVDHVTSPTGLVFPLETLVPLLENRGIAVLVDGAHAPGMLPLQLDALGASYYTGNFHKWLCAPKGAAFLFVREDRRREIRPLSISHGANANRPDRSRFRLEFDWIGTDDPTAFLTAVDALRWMDQQVPGGWTELIRLNRQKALDARRVLATALNVALPCPDSMVGSLASLPLPPSPADEPLSAEGLYPLQKRLLADHRIQVPVVPWPCPPARLVRISAQLYNRPSDYEALAKALVLELSRQASGPSKGRALSSSAQ